MIPQLTGPLVKDVRTGEGILEDLLIVAGPVMAATGNLSFGHTALYMTILAGLKGVRRGLIKVVALQKGVGVGAPVQPSGTFGGQSLASVLDEVDATAEAAEPAAAPVPAPAAPAA